MVRMNQSSLSPAMLSPLPQRLAKVGGGRRTLHPSCHPCLASEGTLIPPFYSSSRGKHPCRGQLSGTGQMLFPEEPGAKLLLFPKSPSGFKIFGNSQQIAQTPPALPSSRARPSPLGFLCFQPRDAFMGAFPKVSCFTVTPDGCRKSGTSQTWEGAKVGPHVAS